MTARRLYKHRNYSNTLNSSRSFGIYVTFCTWQCAIWKSLELAADGYCLEMTNILEEGPVANFENAKKSCEILLNIFENDIWS